MLHATFKRCVAPAFQSVRVYQLNVAQNIMHGIQVTSGGLHHIPLRKLVTCADRLPTAFTDRRTVCATDMFLQ
jgi:hypothetical protein